LETTVEARSYPTSSGLLQQPDKQELARRDKFAALTEKTEKIAEIQRSGPGTRAFSFFHHTNRFVSYA